MTSPLIHHGPIIAHLRARLRELTEQHATMQRDDVRTELIWIEISSVIRDIEIAINQAIEVNRRLKFDTKELQNRVDKLESYRDKILAIINEKDKVLANQYPAVIAANNGVALSQLEYEEVESHEFLGNRLSFSISQYEDKSGYLIIVSAFNSEYEDWREIMYWHYLHKPSTAELMARLTTLPSNRNNEE